MRCTSLFQRHASIKELTALLLVLFLLCGPVMPVFAVSEKSETKSENVSQNVSSESQSATPDGEKVNHESASVGEINQPDDKEKEQKEDDKKEKDKDKKKDDGEAEAQSRLASTPTSLDQAKISSSSRITVDVDRASGALVYGYNFTLPAGRNNMTPSLSLTYVSENKNNDSEIGFGWSFSIPTIERVNKRGTDILYNNTDFSSSLSGELEHISGSQYGARRDDGSYLNYQLSSNIWTVTTKEGTVYTFGGVSDARLSHPSDSSKIYKWYLTKIEDTNGNFTTYSYYKDTTNNAIYPSTITYTNDSSGTGLYAVNFTRENRSDTYTSYAPGFLTKTTQRISKVEVVTNGSWTRKYDFSYNTGDNGTRSMLDSITESGRDESSNTTALPAVDLAYTTGQNTLTHNTTATFPNVTWTDTNNQQQTTPFAFSDPSIRVMDINGDGLKDIVKSYNQEINGVDYPIFWVLRNNGNGWTVDTSWTQPTYSYVNGSNTTITGKFIFNTGIDIGDWNGDAKDDLLRFWREDIGGGQNVQHAVVLLNNGSGWTQDNTVTTDIPTYTDQDNNQNDIYIETGSSQNNYFVDLNGDGLLDYIHATNAEINGVNYPRFAVLYNQNGNLEWDTTVSTPSVTYTQSGNTITTPLVLASSVKVMDINGDGLVDFMWANSYEQNGVPQSAFWVLINNGHGWTQDTSITHPTYTYLDSSDTQQTGYFLTTNTVWRPMDVNGDHLIDLVNLWTYNIGNGINRKAVLVNNGHGWTQNDSLLTVGTYTYTDQNNNQVTGYPNTTTSANTLFFDVNGDGLDDIVNANYIEDSGNYYPRHWFMKNTGSIANLMNEITLPEGGSYAFTYKATSEYVDGSGNLLNASLPSTYNTLHTLTTDDGMGNTATTTYEYANGTYYYNNEYDRRFAGFGKTTTFDALGHKTIQYHHQGNGIQSGETTTDPTDGSKIGKIYREQRYENGTTLVADQYTDWSSYDLGNNRDFVYQSKIVSDEDDRETALEYTFDTTTGNLTSQIFWGKVTASSNTFSDTGTDKKITNYTYTTTGPTRVATVETLNQSNSKINQQKFYYDNQSLGTATDGNETKVESWVEGTTYVDTEKTYTTKGLIATQTDPRNKVTSYAYDSYHMYPATVTNELDQETEYTYNYGIGKAKSITDANNLTTETIYDGLGRIKEVKIPGDTSPYTSVTGTTFTYTDTTGANSILKKEYLSASNTRDTYQYLDGFGRPIQERHEEESGTYATRDIAYNDLGQVARETLPYSSSGTSRTSATTTTALHTDYDYDALGRITAVANALGTVTNDYSGWTTTTTDLRDVEKDITYDAYENIVSVVEHNNSANYTTQYSYEGNNKLTGITDALGNIRSFTYDGIGRRLTATDLHATSDTSYGSWSYEYDDAGNMTSLTDPKNQTITYTYDDLGRPLTENFTGQTGTEVTYTYDTCTLGIGKLCTRQNPNALDEYTYNSRGLMTSTETTLDSTAYVTSTTYDRLGNITGLTYPDGAETRSTYNSAGQLETLERKESGGGWTDVITDRDYGPHGGLTYQAFANGTNTTHTYDSSSLYRRTNTTTMSGTTKLQDTTYTYDDNGNILTLVDDSDTDSARSVAYTYDHLNRLLSATATGVASGSNYTHSYTYDALGNILTRTDAAGTYTYAGNTGTNYANPHAVTSIGSIAYTYDENGNMLTETGGLTNTWDYNNRLSETTKNSITTTYAYNPSGIRVKTDNGTTTTYYPHPAYTVEGTKKIKYISAGSELVATLETVSNTTTPYYQHTDHLTGAQVISNSTGTLEQVMDYYPFGNVRIDEKAGTFSEKHQYAGSEYDSDTGLNYMNARYYESSTGRFTSQDQAFLSMGDTTRMESLGDKTLMLRLIVDPQQMNSYSYVANRPTIAVDQSGHALVLAIPLIEYIGATLITGSVLYIAKEEIVDLVENVIEIKDKIKDKIVDKLTNQEKISQETTSTGGPSPGNNGDKEKRIKELKDSINSHNKTIQEHQEKINALKKGEYSLDPQKIKGDAQKYEEGLINKWQSTIDAANKNIADKTTELNKLIQ